MPRKGDYVYLNGAGNKITVWKVEGSKEGTVTLSDNKRKRSTVDKTKLKRIGSKYGVTMWERKK